jgi:hypothetical protein
VRGSGADTINLPSGTITLNSVANGGLGSLPDITSTVTIDGGSPNPTIDGGNAVRVFVVASSGTLTLNNLTVANANSGSETGGGIVNNGTLKVNNSTFSGNSATGFGGGGIRNVATATVNNSTFSGNSADRGGGISSVFFVVTLKNTIVADNAGGNCVGPFTDAGYNVEDADTCGLTEATGSLPDTEPLLDPNGLQDNGGPTQTIALQPNSSAVDLVGQGACPPPETDQRGVERPQGEACDSGAFELVQGPQTKTDCNNGGWEEFGFKNQGQCIASLRKEQVQTSQ